MYILVLLAETCTRKKNKRVNTWGAVTSEFRGYIQFIYVHVRKPKPVSLSDSICLKRIKKREKSRRVIKIRNQGCGGEGGRRNLTHFDLYRNRRFRTGTTTPDEQWVPGEGETNWLGQQDVTTTTADSRFVLFQRLLYRRFSRAYGKGGRGVRFEAESREIFFQDVWLFRYPKKPGRRGRWPSGTAEVDHVARAVRRPTGPAVPKSGCRRPRRHGSQTLPAVSPL